MLGEKRRIRFVYFMIWLSFHQEKPEVVSLSEAVKLELEETKSENRRLHVLTTELHQKHHEITLKVSSLEIIRNQLSYLCVCEHSYKNTIP